MPGISDTRAGLILHGQRASLLRERPRTPRRLSKTNTLNSPEHTEDYKNYLEKMLAKEDETVANNEILKNEETIVRDHTIYPKTDNSTDYPTRLNTERQWFTQPIHLNTSGMENGEINLHSNAPEFRNGVEKMYNEMERFLKVSGEDFVNYPILASRSLERDYFPVTLGAAQNILIRPKQADLTSKSRARNGAVSNHMKPKTSMTSPRASTSRNSPLHFSTQNITEARNELLMNAPAAAEYLKASIQINAKSPYQYDLACLKMEQLRIEEERLLELKRQEELERIRGPIPKWYEMKTSQFHKEARKNNDLLASKPQWQALMDYRNELVNASKHYSQSLTLY